MNITHLDSESNFKLFQLGRAQNVNIGVCIWFLTKANMILEDIQRAVWGLQGKKNSPEYLSYKHRTEMECLSPNICIRMFLPQWFSYKAGAHDIRWLWQDIRSTQPLSPSLALCSHLLQELFSLKPFLFPAAHQLFNGCSVIWACYRKPSFVPPPRTQSTLVKVLPVLLSLDPEVQIL